MKLMPLFSLLHCSDSNSSKLIGSSINLSCCAIYSLLHFTCCNVITNACKHSYTHFSTVQS